jgi:hypothetical protein
VLPGLRILDEERALPHFDMRLAQLETRGSMSRPSRKPWATAISS